MPKQRKAPLTSSANAPERRWCGTAPLPGGMGSLKGQRGTQSEKGLTDEAHRTREVREGNKGGSTGQEGEDFTPSVSFSGSSSSAFKMLRSPISVPGPLIPFSILGQAVSAIPI